MSNPDEEITLEYRRVLEKKLRIEKKDEFLISYFEIALAFPGGPHSSYFDHQRIDFKAFQPWAEERGWKVTTAPDATHPTQKDTPWIHFLRTT